MWPEELSEKVESCLENYGMKESWKGCKDRNRQKNRIKRTGQAQLVSVKNINCNIPPWEGEAGGTQEETASETEKDVSLKQIWKQT